ncbi:MAG: hypothetical protein IJX12_05175 [Lachnospiraceae bacterium]|nr:hypothetical protein [Lachnospiraceae bacterium]
MRGTTGIVIEAALAFTVILCHIWPSESEGFARQLLVDADNCVGIKEPQIAKK